MYGPVKQNMFYRYTYLLTTPGDKAIENTLVKRNSASS